MILNNKINTNILAPKHPVPVSIRLSLLLALIGGFLDAYTFIDRGGVFANTQTGNIVLLGIHLSNGDWLHSLIYFLPILAFIIGVLVSNFFKDNNKYNAEKAIIIIEIIILTLLAFIPNNISDTFVNIIISFIASVQVSTFRKLVNYPYCSTMCTGNLRSASDAFFLYTKSKDKEQLKKFSAYILIIIFFILGAILSAFITNKYNAKSLLVCVLLLILAYALLHFDKKRDI